MYVALSSVASKECCPLDSTLGRMECSPVQGRTLNVLANAMSLQDLSLPKGILQRFLQLGRCSAGGRHTGAAGDWWILWLWQGVSAHSWLLALWGCTLITAPAELPVPRWCEVCQVPRPGVLCYPFLAFTVLWGWDSPLVWREELYQLKLMLSHLRKNEVSLQCVSAVAR